MRKLIILIALLLIAATTTSAHPVNSLGISRSELERGQSYTAVAAFYRDGPATIRARLALPPGISGGGVLTGTVDFDHPLLLTWRVRVAEDAPRSRVPVPITLMIDGQQVDIVHVRIWTESVVREVWLPLIQK